MLNFINKHKKIIFIICISLTLILLILSLVTKRSVSIDQVYYTKEDVALYLIKYHELPSNYYYTSPSDKRAYEADIYGGFIHQYDEGLLPTSLKDSHFQECDIYTDNYSITNRGIERLVYTTNTRHVRVFYTQDHYESYTELTEFQINLTSHILGILGIIMLIITLVLGAILVINNKHINIKKFFKSHKDDIIDVTANQ